MAVTYQTSVNIGGGRTTGQVSTSSTSWTGAASGDMLVLVVTGNYLTGSSTTDKAVTVDSTWTLVGTQDVAGRVTVSPFTRRTVTVWTKRATSGDLGAATVTVGVGYIGTQREWYATGHVFRPTARTFNATTGGVDNVSDAIATWQSPTATGTGTAVTVYRTANSTGPAFSTANGWTLDYAASPAGFSLHLAIATRAVAGSQTGPTWQGSTAHAAVVFTIAHAGGIYIDGAVHLS
jgi:hypothetical protein